MTRHLACQLSKSVVHIWQAVRWGDDLLVTRRAVDGDGAHDVVGEALFARRCDHQHHRYDLQDGEHHRDGEAQRVQEG